MPQTNYSFPKRNRLKGQKNIEHLLSRASSCTAMPFRILWYKQKSEINNPHLQVAISVSKKNIKKAVRRNLLKRRFREAYRTSCLELTNKAIDKNLKLQILFIYRSKEVDSYASIQKAVEQGLKKIEMSL